MKKENSHKTNPFSQLKSFVTSYNRPSTKQVGKSQSLTDDQIAAEIKDIRRPCSLSVELSHPPSQTLAADDMGQSQCFVAVPHHSANAIDHLTEETNKEEDSSNVRRARHNSEGSSPMEPRPVLKRPSANRSSIGGSKTKKKQVTIEEKATVRFLHSANSDSKNVENGNGTDVNANPGDNKNGTQTLDSSKDIKTDIKKETIKEEEVTDNNKTAEDSSTQTNDLNKNEVVEKEAKEETKKEEKKNESKKDSDSSVEGMWCDPTK